MEQSSVPEGRGAAAGTDAAAEAAVASDLAASLVRVREQETELGVLRGRIAVLERDLRRAEQRLGLVGRLSAIRRRGFVAAVRGRLGSTAR